MVAKIASLLCHVEPLLTSCLLPENIGYDYLLIHTPSEPAEQFVSNISSQDGLFPTLTSSHVIRSDNSKNCFGFAKTLRRKASIPGKLVNLAEFREGFYLKFPPKKASSEPPLNRVTVSELHQKSFHQRERARTDSNKLHQISINPSNRAKKGRSFGSFRKVDRILVWISFFKLVGFWINR